jgi:hypothetical protein
VRNLGRHKLLARLTDQLGGDEEFARNVLRKRGDLDAAGRLTPQGQARDAMTAEERARDRAGRRGDDSSRPYNPRTNRLEAARPPVPLSGLRPLK